MNPAPHPHPRYPTREGFWSTIEAAWAIADVGDARAVMVNFGDNIELKKAAMTLSTRIPHFISALTHILKHFGGDQLDVWQSHLVNFVSILEDWQIRAVLGCSDDTFLARCAWVVAVGRQFYTALEHEPGNYFRLSGYENGCPDLLRLANTVHLKNH